MSVPRYPNETVAEPVHPVDALVEVAPQMHPGQEMNPEQLAIGRALCDERVPIRPIDALAHLAPVGLSGIVESIRKEMDDLEAKLEAERTLRAQASAELEREKARERDRRLESDAAARDRLWAIDALVEALQPLAGFATEEDGRVAGMTAPVCLAMSSVRRADALVKLHRALRR